jgi:hypothetical protein
LNSSFYVCVLKVLMASVTFPVITASSVLELITASVLALAVVPNINIINSATGIPIVAGTAYVQLNGGTTAQWRRRHLLSDSDIPSRRLLQTGLPLVTGDCNGDGLFNANDATVAQTYVTQGVGSWPTGSILQMRNCAPTYSYMFNNIKTFYTAAEISITIADVAYLLSASTNKLFFLNISTPYDLVATLPTATARPWGATATYYYYPSSTSTASYFAVPCASVSGYFEMNVASLPYSIAVGSLYGNTSKGVVFSGSCSSGTYSVTIITDWQNTLNMSVGFINGATNDPYAFFGMDVGAFINVNTNFENIKGSTIVSGPVYTFNMSNLLTGNTFSPSNTPTVSPSTSPDTATPSTAPSTSVPTDTLTAKPSTSPVKNAPSNAPSTEVPTVSGATFSPTVPSSTPSTLAPTVSGVTYSPTTIPTDLSSSAPVTSGVPYYFPSNSPVLLPSSLPTNNIIYNLQVYFSE